MKKYKIKVDDKIEEIDLEDKDYLLITSIDKLTNNIERLRLTYGR